MTSPALRGQIYRADIGFGAKPWLVVSNNQRNRALGSVLAVRVTTTSRHAALPTWVALTSADPLVGYILTDDLQQLTNSELTDLLGSLSPATMLAVNYGLRVAMAIP